MCILFRHLTTRDLITKELPAFVFSLLTAEMLYKFRSFSLECIAFLATWYVVSYVVRRVAPSAEPVPKERMVD
jgi:hypothetical protein